LRGCKREASHFAKCRYEGHFLRRELDSRFCGDERIDSTLSDFALTGEFRFATAAQRIFDLHQIDAGAVNYALAPSLEGSLRVYAHLRKG
jgi:hypothetical protein